MLIFIYLFITVDVGFHRIHTIKIIWSIWLIKDLQNEARLILVITAFATPTRCINYFVSACNNVITYNMNKTIN